jgi:hypothetical protein
MDTTRLAELIRVKVVRRNSLQGLVRGSPANEQEKHTLNRELRVLTPILKKRQKKMEGF